MNTLEATDSLAVETAIDGKRKPDRLTDRGREKFEAHVASLERLIDDLE